MPKNKNVILYATGYAFLGDDDLFDITEAQLTLGLDVIEAQLKNSVHTIATGQPLRAHLVAAGLNLNLLSRLTGGSVASGSKRKVDEELTKSADALTLTQTPEDTNHIRIVPVGANKSPLAQVASSPSVGEYSISGTTVSLNASQSEDDFRCIYFYTDSTGGDTLSIDPDDLPSSFELFLTVPARDIFPGSDGDLIIEAAKAERTSEITIGGSKGNHQAFELDVNIRNDNNGDFKIYLYAE